MLGLLLGVWTTASVGSAIAEATVAGASAIGAHVESPDAARDHGPEHAHDCAFCQALQWTGVTPPTVTIGLAKALAEPVPSDARLARGGLMRSHAPARAPPFVAI